MELYTKKERKKINIIQRSILTIKNALYIFASEKMKLYSVDMYNIPEKNSFVCINGGILLKEKKRRFSKGKRYN